MEHDLVLVRSATCEDLPRIRALIRESFAAMTEHGGPAFEEACAREAQNVIDNGDLSAERFAEAHLSGPAALGFWVAEHRELGVIGCIGLERTSAQDGELVRMSVSTSMRGEGIGAKLLGELVALARERGIVGISLKTLNPRAARFYRKHGFVSVSELPITFEHPAKVTLTQFEMSRSGEEGR